MKDKEKQSLIDKWGTLFANTDSVLKLRLSEYKKYSQFYNKLDKLLEREAFDEANAFVDQQIDNAINNAGNPSKYYYALCGVHYAKSPDVYLAEEKDCLETEAIPYIEKCIEPYNGNGHSLADVLASLCIQEYYIGDFQQARRIASWVASRGITDGFYNENAVAKCIENFPVFDEAFVKEQLQTLEYDERMFLLVVDKYGNLWESSYLPVLSNELATKYLQFPAGHPCSNQLYIAHPCTNEDSYFGEQRPRIKNYYVPFEDYHRLFSEEQVREYCELVRALGAAEITIECLNKEQGDNHQWMESLRQSMEMHQTYQPIEAPHIPENLVWYPKERTWQRLAIRRLEGSLISHDEYFDLKDQNWQIEYDKYDLDEIKCVMQEQLTTAGVNVSKAELDKYQLQEKNLVLCIKTTFIPLDQLPPAEQSQTEN